MHTQDLQIFLSSKDVCSPNKDDEEEKDELVVISSEEMESDREGDDNRWASNLDPEDIYYTRMHGCRFGHYFIDTEAHEHGAKYSDGPESDLDDVAASNASQGYVCM